MRTSLDVTYHGGKYQIPLFLAKYLEFLFLVSFGKKCTPISLFRVLKKQHFHICVNIWV